jgi:hypothetical protein
MVSNALIFLACIRLLLSIRCRNFAATQTKGVRCAIYQKYPSKVEAEEEYANALRDGYVEVLDYD